MSAWRSAEHRHRRYLQRFVCAERPWRRLRKHRYLGGEWASRVQGTFRKLRPPFREPEYLKLNISRNGRRINAAVWFKVDARGGKSEVVVGALGVTRALQRTGLGEAALFEVAETAFAWTLRHAPAATEIFLTAQVHQENIACQRLISKNGWIKTAMDPDGVHEVWGAVVRIE